MPDIEDAMRRNAFLLGVIGWWRDRRLKGRTGDLGDTDEVELARIARDLGVTRRDIERLVEAGPEPARLLDRMLASHRIPLLGIVGGEPDLYADMAIRCASCAAADRCRGELDAGTARDNAGAFCPNAEIMRDYVV